MLDIVLGTVILVSVGAAARKGFTREVFGIASLVLGVLVAMWGYGPLATALGGRITDSRLSGVLAFVLIFVTCLLVGGLVARMVSGMWEWTGLRWMDMLLGGLFGLVRGTLLAGLLLLALLAFQPFQGTTTLVADSKIAPWVINVARTAASLAPGALREAFRRGVDAVEKEVASDHA